MNEIIFVVEESDEGGYEARALGESIFTDAGDLSQLRQRVREATECHFDEEERPALIRLFFVREEILAVAWVRLSAPDKPELPRAIARSAESSRKASLEPIAPSRLRRIQPGEKLVYVFV